MFFSDDEKLTSEDRAYYFEAAANDRTVQNVSRSLEWTDHGKEVKCVATHIALDRPKETKVQLDVHCKYT